MYFIVEYPYGDMFLPGLVKDRMEDSLRPYINFHIFNDKVVLVLNYLKDH